MTQVLDSLSAARAAASPLAGCDADRLHALETSVATYGFAAWPGALAPDTLAAMRTEAEARLGEAALLEQDGPLSHRAHLTSLGPVILGFLSDDRVTGLLTRLFGGRFAISEHISCLTQYGDAGHLGAHLDEPAEDCAVTIILYLSASSPDPGAADTGLMLKVYGTDRESLAAAPRLSIPTRAGTLVLGRGSRVWHERPRLQRGESVIAVTGCYRRIP